MELLRAILKFISNLSLFNANHVDSYNTENLDNAKEVEPIKAEDSAVEFKNESSRLSSEWTSLLEKNAFLHGLIRDINTYTQTNFKKTITLTMIYRTDQEQAYLYKDDARYKERQFKSPHQFWHAVDIRSRTFTDSEVTKLVAYINDKYDADNYYRWTAKNHNVGSGIHFHIQFSKK